MEVNKEKSAIMALRKDRRTPGVERGRTEERIEGIGVVTSYKYLGVVMEDTMKCNVEDNSAKEASKLGRRMETIFRDLKNIPAQLTIQRTLCHSKGNYASSLMYTNPENAKRINKQWRRMISASYRLPRNAEVHKTMTTTL